MTSKPIFKITREKAVDMIMNGLNRKPYEEMSDGQLVNMLKGLGYGEDPDKECYGFDIRIENKERETDDEA